VSVVVTFRRKMSSLLVVMSRSWLRPRIFNHHLNHISYGEDRHCIHIHMKRKEG